MSFLEHTDNKNQAPGARDAAMGVREALSDVVGETKQLAANHLELRVLELRGLVEGYAGRTFAACVAMLFFAMGLTCLTAAAVLALSHGCMSQEAACATVGASSLAICALLSWRASKPVQLPAEPAAAKGDT